MKINEVILEALNKSTGTPNPAPPQVQPATEPDQAKPMKVPPQWSGRQSAPQQQPAQQAQTQQPVQPAPAPQQPAQPAPAPKPGEPGFDPQAELQKVNQLGKSPAAKPAQAPAPQATQQQAQPTAPAQQPAATPAPQTQTAPVDTEYQDQLDKNIQQKQQAAIKSAQANTPAQKIKSGFKKLGKAFNNGIQGPATAQSASATQTGPDPTEPDPFKDAGAIAKGIGNWAKSRIPGTQANAQRKLDAADEKANLATAQRYVTNWNQGVKANPRLNTPQELRKFATRLATKDGRPLFNPPVPKDMSPGGVTQYLNDIVARITSGLETGVEPSKATKTKQATAAATNAFGQMANQLGGQQDDDLAGTIPGKGVQADLQKQAQAAGVQIKSQEPIIISTGKGKEYGLNDQGQWIHLASGKVPPQSFAKFLDQQHDISLGLGQQPAPQQPTQ